jgi:DnaJ-class molecular chaperone
MMTSKCVPNAMVLILYFINNRKGLKSAQSATSTRNVSTVLRRVNLISRCDYCKGKGKVIHTKCHVCHGEKTIKTNSWQSLFIEKGIKDGGKIVW